MCPCIGRSTSSLKPQGPSWPSENIRTRRCLTLGDRGFMAGRGRVSRCSLPLEARGLESRSPFCGGEGRLRSSDLNGPSLSMPDDKATRPLEPLRLTEEAGKWPDQSGQSRLCRTASELLRLESPSNDEAPKRTWQLPHRAVTAAGWTRARTTLAAFRSEVRAGRRARRSGAPASSSLLLLVASLLVFY